MCYDYITAANGVFIEAEGKLMAARIPICQPTWASIRGLALDTAKIALRHGPIPKLIFDTAVGMLYVQKNIEGYIAIVWDEAKAEYSLFCPYQNRETNSVAYEIPDNVVMDIHSHPGRAFFSAQDNSDEQGLKLYMVVGLKKTEFVLRVGVYGYFHPILWTDIFTGEPNKEELIDAKPTHSLNPFIRCISRWHRRNR
jgi:PRTRC genetic system protein A